MYAYGYKIPPLEVAFHMKKHFSVWKGCSINYVCNIHMILYLCLKKPMNLVAIIVELNFLKWQTWQHFFMWNFTKIWKMNIRDYCVIFYFLFPLKIDKIRNFFAKNSPHWLWFQFGSKFFTLLQIRQVLKACHHLKSTPSWDATQHDATWENSKTFSLNAPKFLKCLFKKEWLVSNNWGLNPKPFFFQKFAKRVHSFLKTKYSLTNSLFVEKTIAYKRQISFCVGGGGRVSSHLCILLTVLRVPWNNVVS
jgi:hypothetical protein